MKKNSLYGLSLVFSMVLVFSSCQNEDLLSNPNASETATPSLVLNNLTANMALAEEKPFAAAHKANQYIVANYSYYWGNNYYNWSNSETQYSMLRYAIKLEEEAVRQYGAEANVYSALSLFFKAYAGIWLSQRVGDIPFNEAGDPNNLTPVFDSQQDVYQSALALLEEANTMLGSLIQQNLLSADAVLDASGDIFGLTNVQWQKVINTFRLRVLISMSRRATDSPDLEIAQKVAAIWNDIGNNPLMESNADNMVYLFNQAYNVYPVYNSRAYSYGVNIGKTLLDITTVTADPRTFIFATPAPEQYNVGNRAIDDFASYVGASTNATQAELFAETDKDGGSTSADQSAYSYVNYLRYFGSQDGSTTEHYILLSYAEMCFNIAEAIHRGWIVGSVEEWYTAGIEASLAVYGIVNGSTLAISDRLGRTLGTTIADVDQFLQNPNLRYKGAGEDGLRQIIEQKYVASFCQAGYESYFNWLRTGYPIFEQGGAGIGTPTNEIAKRWMYPQSEISYNATNYQDAIASQYGGNDDITLSTWLFE